MDSAQGQLLIAGPTLVDPNFWRTVVLIVEHSDEGAFGVVLNRPSDTSVDDAVPELHSVLDCDELLFVGGPVQPSAVILLAQFEDPGEAGLLAFGDVGVLRSGPEEELGTGVRRARAFVGHSGWGPGQLDAELERGDWILEPARPADAFTETAAELWKEVLIRKGGSYALIARMPPDPSLN